ncbi:MAG TPA: phasin family protein [Solimonas sp.]|nr:phasin family protein [Solimonas sp.]
MTVETIVNDVKARADVVVARGQDVLEAGLETLKTANGIVVEGVQNLVETNVSVGKELITLAQASLEKAKTDGIKAVAANPVAYLPEGKDKVVGAYTDSLALVTKTGDELAKTLKQGFETISAKIQGDAPVVAKAKKTTKKTVAKAKKAAKAA